jgi:hypothetical protein
MDIPRPAIRQANGDLLVPAQAVELLENLLHRVQRAVGKLEGQSCARPGHMETGNEIAQRQDSVNKLSASVGVIPPTVTARPVADEHYLLDTSQLLDDLKALTELLFTAGDASK